MRLCIDTGAYSALKKGEPSVADLLESAEEVLVSTVVLGELYAAFSLGGLERKNLQELRAFLGKPGVTICPVTDEIAQRYGTLVKTLRQQGTPLPTNDIWIAAAALETGCRLVTFDEHFTRIPTLLIET